MKIGVITWFKYENFGTALQATALQTYLKNEGHDVELIDFKIPIPRNNRPSKKKRLYDVIGSIINKIDSFFYKKERAEKSEKFGSFIKNNCKISIYVEDKDEYVKLCNSYDCIIFGSDQIWNPNWHHPFYFANLDEILTDRVSYAPSFGVSKIDSGDKKNIEIALKKFKRISVREDSGASIVEKMIHKRPAVVVDPTLLLGKREWEKFEKKIAIDRKYILCYMLTDNKNHWKAIKSFIKQKKLIPVILPYNGHSVIQSKNIIRNAGPNEFLSLLKNAEYVITDSYHATIFSYIYNKKLILIERHNPTLPDAENSRLYDFLRILNMEDKILPFNSNQIKDDNTIVFENNNELKKLIQASKRYLRRIK